MRAPKCSLLLLIVVLLSLAVPLVNASETMIKVAVNSDIYGTETIELMHVNDSLYARGEDISRYSGINYSVEKDIGVFTYGVESVMLKCEMITGETQWFDLESSLTSLGANAEDDNGILRIVSNPYVHVFNFCSSVFPKGDSSPFEIDYMENSAGMLSLLGSYAWEIAQFRWSGILSDFVSNNNVSDTLPFLQTFEGDALRSCLTSMITFSKNEESLVDSIVELHELASLGGEGMQNIGKIFGSEYSSELEGFLYQYGSDTVQVPAGFMKDSIVFLDSLAYTADLYLTGLDKTLNTHSTNNLVGRQAKIVKSLYEEQANRFNSLIKYTLNNALDYAIDFGIDKLGEKAVEELVSNCVGGFWNLSADIIDMGFKISDKSEAYRYSTFYRQIQQELKRIYYSAADRNDYVTMKHASLLFLRAYAKSVEAFDFDQDTIALSKEILKHINSISAKPASISDSFLNGSKSSISISVNDLTIVEGYPAMLKDYLNMTFEDVFKMHGYNYHLTSSGGSGILYYLIDFPFTEYAFFYEYKYEDVFVNGPSKSQDVYILEINPRRCTSNYRLSQDFYAFLTYREVCEFSPEHGTYLYFDGSYRLALEDNDLDIIYIWYPKWENIDDNPYDFIDEQDSGLREEINSEYYKWIDAEAHKELTNSNQMASHIVMYRNSTS